MNRDIIESNVKLLISVRGISQTNLAALMGVSRQRVIQIIDRPTKRGVAAIAAALSIPAEWLTDEHLADKSIRELRGE